MKDLKLLIVDIDGVMTDGKVYVSENVPEMKNLTFKDLDAIKQIKELGIKVGCVSGEDTFFSNFLVKLGLFDFFRLGEKDKLGAVESIGSDYAVQMKHIAYIGDGKYDIPAMKAVGVSFCPADAIGEVKEISSRILSRKGGEGCLAEVYSLLAKSRLSDNSAIRFENDELDNAKSYCVNQYITNHKNLIDNIINNEAVKTAAISIANRIIRAVKNEKKVLLCGNGGSAADSQHIAAELVGRFKKERPAIPAIALTTDTSILTAVSNDYSFNKAFSRQIDALANEGDVVIGISTSGESESIVEALKSAKNKGAVTVLFTGKKRDGMEIYNYSDYILNIPSDDTALIQEMHIMFGHIICELVEKILEE